MNHSPFLMAVYTVPFILPYRIIDTYGILHLVQSKFTPPQPSVCQLSAKSRFLVDTLLRAAISHQLSALRGDAALLGMGKFLKAGMQFLVLRSQQSLCTSPGSELPTQN